VRALTVVNALSATVSPAEEAALRSNPAVSEVVPDSAIKVQTGLTLPTATLTSTAKSAPSSVARPTGTCAADGGVQLNPEAIEAISADSDVPGAKTARSLGFTGQSTTVSVTTQNPGQAGDLSASLAFSSPQAGRSSIPMTLRTEIATHNGSGSFSADIQGGNGRGYVPAQSEFYVVNVPKGQPALDVQLALGSSETDPYYAYLVAPNGENPARASNQTLGGSGTSQTVASSSGAELHTLDPEAGQWTIIVTFTNPVTGDALDSTLHGHVSFAPIAATGVPRGGVLTRGKPVTVSVTVHNGS